MRVDILFAVSVIALAVYGSHKKKIASIKRNKIIEERLRKYENIPTNNIFGNTVDDIKK